MPVNQPRFYELDLLRFFAAASVMLYHFTYRGWAQGDDMTELVLPNVGQFFKYGFLGVDIFFMISGFVILMSVQGRSAADFVTSRIVRLYPAYWFCVSTTAIFIYLFADHRFSIDLETYLANMTMLHKFIGYRHVDGVYWSLIVELKFYLLIFALVLIRQLHRVEIALAAWLACSAIGLYITLPGIVEFLFVPRWSAYFVAGACAFLAAKSGWTRFRIALYSLSFLIATAYLDAPSWVPYVALTSFFVLFIAIAHGWLQSFCRSWFVTVGMLTYPLYLLHQNVGFILFNQLFGSINKYLLLLGVITIMLIISWAIAMFIERPLGGWLRTWIKRGTLLLPNVFHVKSRA